jgi:hypothetical protein
VIDLREFCPWPHCSFKLGQQFGESDILGIKFFSRNATAQIIRVLHKTIII